MNWSSKWPDPPVEDNKGGPNQPTSIIEIDCGSGPLPNDGSVAWGSKKIKGEWSTAISEPYWSFITINDKNIQVTKVGDLALAYEDDGWTLFHVPTLQVCSKLVPCKHEYKEIDGYDYSREALLAWMQKVQEHHKGYWASLAQLTPKNYEGKMQLTKDLLFTYCQSIPVEE